MFDQDTIKWFTSLGVGGALALFWAWVYRKDALEWVAAWKGQTELLLDVVKEMTAAMTALSQQCNVQMQMSKDLTNSVHELTGSVSQLVESQRFDRRQGKHHVD